MTRIILLLTLFLAGICLTLSDGPVRWCRHNNFRCHNGRICIPNSYRCDGKNDCGDMSDERPENCPRRTSRISVLPYPRNDTKTVAKWEKEAKKGLERVLRVLGYWNAQRVKLWLRRFAFVWKRQIKFLNSTDVKTALKQVSYENMVKGWNLEKKLKELQIIASIREGLHLEQFSDNVPLKAYLEKFLQNLDENSLKQGMQNILKGINLVNYARSMDSIIHGVDLDILRKGVESLVLAFENTVRDLDLVTLFKTVKDLLTKIKDLDFSEFLLGVLELSYDVDKLTRSMDKDNIIRIIKGMIKTVDFESIRRKIVNELNDLKTTLEVLDLTEIKPNLLNALDKMKTRIKMTKYRKINIEAFVKGLDLDKILGHFDLRKLFKGLENLLDVWGLDRILKIFGVDEILKDVGVIVRTFAELLESLDLKSFVKKVVGILTKSLDFDNIEIFLNNLLEAYNTDNLFEGYKKMVNGMDFESLRRGDVNLITGLKSVFNGGLQLDNRVPTVIDRH